MAGLRSRWRSSPYRGVVASIASTAGTASSASTASTASTGQGRPLPRLLAIADSRALVRALFLASGASSGILAFLGEERTIDEIGQRTECRRPDRLGAWLGVGVELGELRCRGGLYRVSGHRARALSGGDQVLVAHYRSMLEYQVGPYAEVDQLLRTEPGGGRDDLDRYADDIARVSLAAVPFVTALVRRTVDELRPARVLDVGCGTGAYTRAVLGSSATVEVDGVDLAPGVVEAARKNLSDAGLGSRARLHAGDIRDWLRQSQERFDLALMLNNIYYFDPASRRELYRELGTVLPVGAQLLLVSMTTPGSIAAAHLHFMLVCQAGAAALPVREELVADLVAAGYEIVEERRLVPTEPFVGIRARHVV